MSMSKTEFRLERIRTMCFFNVKCYHGSLNMYAVNVFIIYDASILVQQDNNIQNQKAYQAVKPTEKQSTALDMRGSSMMLEMDLDENLTSKAFSFCGRSDSDGHKQGPAEVTKGKGRSKGSSSSNRSKTRALPAGPAAIKARSQTLRAFNDAVNMAVKAHDGYVQDVLNKETKTV